MMMALLTEYRTLLVEYRALLTEYTALFTEYRILLTNDIHAAEYTCANSKSSYWREMGLF